MIEFTEEELEHIYYFMKKNIFVLTKSSINIGAKLPRHAQNELNVYRKIIEKIEEHDEYTNKTI